MTMVTCPSFRYHPAVVAQKAATIGVLSGGRFTLGLGAGERLNEHVVGGGWPSAQVRHERLAEAAGIIRSLFSGDYVTYQGQHFRVDRAKIYDLPDSPPPIGIAVSGPASVWVAAEHGDCMIPIEPKPELVRGFDVAGGAGKPRYGQLAICYDSDLASARSRARELWRWAVGGWHVMSELPGPRAFDAASAYVGEDDVASVVACGPDPAAHVTAARKFIDAGYTHLALVQIGADTQDKFLTWAAGVLLPALRQLG